MMAKEYVRPIPATWWLRKRSYFLFILRELTSVFVGAYAVFLLVLVARADDPQSFAALFDALKSPLSIALHLITLAMVLFHSVTWINLTPQVMVLWLGERRVSPVLIAASNHAAWLAVSGLVGWIVLR